MLKARGLFFPSFMILAMLCAVALTGSIAMGQTQTTGAVVGTVLDPSGAAVTGAAVQLLDKERGGTLDSVTDDTGSFRFTLLHPGLYQVTTAAKGFRRAITPVTVTLGQSQSLEIKLELGTAAETIEVTSETGPLVQTDNANVNVNLTETQVSEIPNPGNDLSYIAQISPGTTMNTQGGYGNFSAFGMSATSNLFTLNGMDDNDPFLNLNNSGATNLLLGQNEIAEATVVANGYTGQYGTLAGSNINYITKSGSNNFHGNAIYEWNGRAMNANDWFRNEDGDPRSFDNANQWAGSFGGRIKKDKLFFFINTEGLRVVLPTSNNTIIPSPAFETATIANLTSLGLTNSIPFYNKIFSLYNGAPGAATAQPGNGAGNALGCSDWTGPDGLGTTVPCALYFRSSAGNLTHEWQFAGRVDWNISEKNRAYMRIQYDDGVQATYTDGINSIFNAVSTQPEWQGQLVDSYSVSPTLTNQFVLSGQWYTAIFSNANINSTLSTFPTTLSFGDGTFTDLGGEDYIWPQGRNVTQYQISDDVTKTIGRHTVKFGVKFRRNDVSDHDYGFYTSGYLLPLNVDAFYNGGTDPTTPASAGNFSELYYAYPSSLDQPMALWSIGAYGEDDWKIRSNFTVTLALRAEHQSNPVCQKNCFARLTGPFSSINTNPDIPYNQIIDANEHQALLAFDNILWQPRIGFAWQVRGGAHTTVVRGGGGIFYDAFPGTVVDNFSENPPIYNFFVSYLDNLAPTETTNLFADANASNAAFVSGYKSGLNVNQISAIDEFFSPPSITGSEKTTHAPQYQKWNLEVQQQIAANTFLDVNYVGNHGYHELIVNNSVNAYGFGSLPATVPDASFGQVTTLMSAGVSNYNGLTVSATERWGKGSLIQANYTWSHAFDDVSNGGELGFTGNSTLNPQDPYNVHANYGPSDYDVRQGFNLNYVWQVPIRWALHGHGWNRLVDGWQLAGAVFVRTGLPYSVTDRELAGSLGSQNYFATIYAIPTVPLSSIPKSSCGKGAAGTAAVQCLTLADFENPSPTGTPQTQFSYAGLRNAFRGPGYTDFDLNLTKFTHITESMELGLGLQFYNLFNHANFTLPVSDVSNSQFGTIQGDVCAPTSILGSFLGGNCSPRLIQLKAQLRF